MSVRKKSCLNDFIIVDGCVLNKKRYTVAASEETNKDIWTEWPPSNFVSYFADGREDPWGCMMLNKNGVKYPKIIHVDDTTYLVVDNERSVFYSGLGQENKYWETEISHSLVGSVENVHNIHGTIYVVGINRAVVRREGRNKWTLISQDIKKEAEDKLDVFQAGFNSLDGFAAKEDLYAGGGHSDMWHYDGEHWRSIDLPVLRMRIAAVVCASDEQVYAVGRFGTIVQGRGDHWKVIQQTLTDSDFTDAAWYNNRLYLCTSSTLYELKDGELKETEFGGAKVPFSFGHLHANDGLLMSAGAYSIAIYNGQDWRVLHGAASHEKGVDAVLMNKMLTDADESLDAASEVLDELKNLPKK